MKRIIRRGLLLTLAAGAWPAHAASTIQFSAAVYNVTEGEPHVLVVVQRTNDLDTVVSVDFATSNLTATAGLDYTEVVTNVTFDVGETNRGIIVPILNDGRVEGLETFLVALSNPAGGALLGSRSNTVVRITDNDKGMVLEFSSYRASEAEPYVLIGVTRGDDGDFPVTVDVRTADGSALAGADYTGITNTVSFAPGERIKLLTVPILNDGLTEASETFRLILGNPTGGGVLGVPATATVTLIDNDPGVQFTYAWTGEFTSVSYGAHEFEGGVNAVVTRGNDGLLEPFTVRYAARDLTATNGLDYFLTEGVLEFAAGQMTRQIWIPIANDGILEADKRFELVLSEPSGGMNLGRFGTAAVTIWDSTGWAPHGFGGIRQISGGQVESTLAGSVSARFRPFFDWYLVDTATELSGAWMPWSQVLRTNSVARMPVLTDSAVAGEAMRFFRVQPEVLVTPRERPTGPYAVGKVERWVTDPSRRNRYDVSTNSSMWMTVWYPAERVTGRLPTRFVEEAVIRQELSSWYDRVAWLFSYAFLDAPLLPGTNRFPVVLASHGGSALRIQNDERAENLASHGFIVVATDHRDNLGVVFPDGSIHDTPEEVTDAGLNNRVLDLRFLLDQLEEWGRNDPIFSGRLDLNHVAAMGLSWGGVTAADVCRLDARFRAAVMFDSGPAFTAATLAQGLSVPTLTINAAGNSDQGVFSKAVAGSVWLQISATEHVSFTDVAFIYTGYSMASISEASRTVNAYVLAFLSQHFKGQAATFPLAGFPRAINVKTK